MLCAARPPRAAAPKLVALFPGPKPRASTRADAAVTYHELYKLAARDAVATLQADRWRALYHELDVAGDGDGRLSRDEVSQRLSELDAPEREADSILRALFTGSGDTVGIEQFVRRAQRLQSPLRLDLMRAT